MYWNIWFFITSQCNIPSSKVSFNPHLKIDARMTILKWVQGQTLRLQLKCVLKGIFIWLKSGYYLESRPFKNAMTEIMMNIINIIYFFINNIFSLGTELEGTEFA